MRDGGRPTRVGSLPPFSCARRSCDESSLRMAPGWRSQRSPAWGNRRSSGRSQWRSKRGGRDAFRVSLFSRRTPPRVLTEALAAGAITSSATVLIDDFDWFDFGSGSHWLADELLGSGARAVTASVDPPPSIGGAEEPEIIGPSDLVFSRKEYAVLFVLVNLGGDAKAAEELVWRIARGGAGGTLCCLEWLLTHPGDLAGVPAAYERLASVSLHISVNDVPEDWAGAGMLAGGRKIRLLPQLSIPLVSSLLGQAAVGSLGAFARQPTVLVPVRGREES